MRANESKRVIIPKRPQHLSTLMLCFDGSWSCLITVFCKQLILRMIKGPLYFVYWCRWLALSSSKGYKEDEQTMVGHTNKTNYLI